MASLRLLHLNEDTSWLIQWRSAEDAQPFNLVIDPWLTDSQVDYFPLFSKQTHVVKPVYSSISDLEKDLGPVSAILNTVEYTDHTHKETLSTARPQTPVFARRNAKNRIDSWKIFEEPVAQIRQYSSNPKDATADLPDSLSSLAKLAGWSEERQKSVPSDVSVMWVPTDAWFNPTGDKLHGVAIIKFDVPEGQDRDPTSYTILYSPHGIPPTALEKVLDALNAIPGHQCVALLHHFDQIKIIGAGSVFLGLDSGASLASLVKPHYWIRTHDEEKKAEGYISKVMYRHRETREKAEGLVPDSVKVLELGSGRSFELLQAD